MKKGLTELVFILDRSGSMGGLESDTVGGFNGMLERQKKEDGEANVTTVLFDDQYEMIHDRFPIAAVKPLTEEEYYVRGCTALLDAIGKTIVRMKDIQKHLPEDYRAEKVVFVITTDGLENASREYDHSKVRKLVEGQKECGWEFVFLGANMDAIGEAKKFGISEDRAVEFLNDSVGIKKNYHAVGKLLSRMRSAEYNMCEPCVGAAPCISGDWKEEIEEDMKVRGGMKKRK